MAAIELKSNPKTYCHGLSNMRTIFTLLTDFDCNMIKEHYLWISELTDNFVIYKSYLCKKDYLFDGWINISKWEHMQM